MPRGQEPLCRLAFPHAQEGLKRPKAEEAAKTHPRWNRGWGGGLDGPQFFAVAPAGGPPLVGGRPGGGHPECLHGCAIERQAIEQLGEVRFRAATTH